jgi:hypothetical protein
MRSELAAAFVAASVAPFVAGLFGLIPLMVQIATSRAQRRDRIYRLNQLQAELELLERLHALQAEVSASDEATKPQTDLVISDSVRKLLEQYNELSEITPSAATGSKQPSPEQHSFLRRAFLMYNPHTTAGWLWHTLFYIFASILVFLLFGHVSVLFGVGWTAFLLGMLIFVLPVSIALLIFQRLARHHAVRSATQLEEPNA